MKLIPKILPADIMMSPYDKYVETSTDKTSTIIILLIALLLVVAITTIIVIAAKRKAKKNRSKIEEKENEYELDTEDTTR